MGGPNDGADAEGFPYFDGTRYALGGLCAEFRGPGAAPGEGVLLVDLGLSQHLQGHFDDVFMAMMSVFRIVTFDNWTDQLSASMRGTHPAAALYFVALIFIGDYYILSLFLSILLSNFARENSRQKKLVREDLREKRRTRRISAAGLVGTVVRRAVTGARRAHVTGSRLLSSFRLDDPNAESLLGIKPEKSLRGDRLLLPRGTDTSLSFLQAADSQRPPGVRAVARPMKRT